VDEITDRKIAQMSEELNHMRKFKNKERDLFFMMYEDVRSQCYEFKFMIDQQNEEIRTQSLKILNLLTREK